MILDKINLPKVNKIEPMHRKKKISDVSEPTQPEREKRFVRQSPHCSSNCKSSSIRKSLEKNDNLEMINLITDIPVRLPLKNHTVSMKFCKNPEERMTPPLKASTGSMRFDFHEQLQPNQQSCELSSQKQSEVEKDEVKALRSQNRKLKVYLNEEREKRRLFEEQAILNKQQIKRLQKRLEKYGKEKARLREEREFMLAHIEELENSGFSQQLKDIHSYRLRAAEQDQGRLREELQRKKTEREKELLQQIESLIQQNYHLQKELSMVNLAKDAITKQLEEADQELEEMRVAIRQKVARSAQYIELRERYRILLVEIKWLRQEIQHLENLRGEGPSLMEGTLLTMSADSVQLQ